MTDEEEREVMEIVMNTIARAAHLSMREVMIDDDAYNRLSTEAQNMAVICGWQLAIVSLIILNNNPEDRDEYFAHVSDNFTEIRKTVESCNSAKPRAAIQ